MKLHVTTIATASLLAFYCNPLQAQGSPCPFNNKLTCTIERDILNDIGSNGLRYYAPTNYNHRFSGEIELYNSNQVFPYTDSTDAPGQLELQMKNNNGSYISGEVMTRVDLNQPPYNAPVASNRWTTQEISHGYVEVVLKMPECQTSSDGVCNKGNPPNNYSEGFWPSIWMLPTMDTDWPENGEIDITEAYKLGTNYNVSTATLHFNGTSPECNDGNCVNDGYSFANSVTPTPLWSSFHTWGFEWEPDPASTDGGQIITGYFDNVLAWGPARTDALPADGPGAFSRGFNDPNGGFYLIVAFAVGGGYAGAPNPQTLSAALYLQSAKAYTVSVAPPPPPTCLPPINIQSMYEPDMKEATFAWEQPTGSATISNYQVLNWEKNVMWTGSSPTVRYFQDQTLPGKAGTYTYYFQTVCGTATSTATEYNLTMTLKKK